MIRSMIQDKVKPTKLIIRPEVFDEMMDTANKYVLGSPFCTEEYLAKNSADIISQIDPEVITNLVKVTIAKKVQEDHDRLMSRIDPLARSIPDLNKQHNERMQAILKQS